MTWRKLGLIQALEPAAGRATTHMQGPVAVVLDDRIRIYFAARDAARKSFPGYLDVDRSDPLRVLQLRVEPVVPRGPLGTFDDDGNMPACAVEVGSALWLYYSGWNARLSVPYHNTTGIAISHDRGDSFERMFNGPILDRTPKEPFMAVTPWVSRDEDVWRMWYVSGLGWHEIAGRQEPLYAIMSATSGDGIEWHRSGEFTVPRRHEFEAIARPTVVRRGSAYHMWYCYRDSVDFRDGVGSYRVGYARSEDGEAWRRDDRLAGIDVSASGWDSSMICYPYIVECAGDLIMFYNGNGFGQTGIGCAVWERSLPGES